MNINVTRKSKVGFGYTSAVENDERGNLKVCDVSAPTHTGTIIKVEKAISEDRTLASYRGGTYYRWAWFVRVNGKWCKVEPTDENNWNIRRLTEKSRNMFGELKYEADAVTVTVS